MNTKITQETFAKRPSTTPLGSSVLDHATVVTKSDFGLRNIEGLWPSYNCLDMAYPTLICPDPMAVGKTFQSAEWVPALEFAIYGGAQCKTVGLDVEDQKSEVARVFGANEGKSIEQVLRYNRFVATTSGEPVQWAAPVDLTPTGGPTGLFSLQLSLALLEGYAAATYAGVPTIHMPRAAASVLNERIVWEGDKAFTRSGAKVAIGGGYDVSEDDGTWDMYATGEVYVERSEEISTQVYKIPGDGATQDDNTVLALSERMFRVAVDCFVAKATAKVW